MSLLERTHDGETKDPPSSSSYEFTHAAAKSAVAQICETVGYNHFKDPPLESLTGFAIQYILQLGKLAASFANLNGRSQCNVFDIVLALEDLSGNDNNAEGRGCSALRSVKLREIIDFVKVSDDGEEESLFLQALPRFPVSDKGKKMMMMTVPSFVEETPMWIERVGSERDKIEQARQRRKAERALLSLQRKLVCRISSGGGDRVWGDMDVGTVKEVIREAESEVPEDEKRDGVSVVEAFAPALEAARDVVFSEDDAEWKQKKKKKKKKKKKPVALSKLRTEKKFLGEPLDLTLQMKGEDRSMSLREEDRDDKRRRAEFILRQCMENPVDLNQL
ncbi:hypothetical protein Bca52824_095787 [Brassica carinata]|uniref:Bromodomain associated domain-containing protein n=1 Tax=Brassica carinata TaxID=52824 RepID=A0A8X7NZN1_BRACI|nr:hypothetical protein Bca52824_095787 [Brassica carinata]